MDTKGLVKKAAQIRVDVLTAIHRAGSGYSGSSMSVVEIMTALYYGDFSGRPVASIDPAKAGSAAQDYIFLLKGQAAPVQYAILADLGFFSKTELDYYRQLNSMLSARPSIKVPGIWASLGGHGYGLSIAVGTAIALKSERKPNRVFAVIGDGELQEGQVWEAAMSAAHYNLDNLVLFVDKDDFQSDGPTKAVMDLGNLQDKFEAFGWKVLKVLDGHDFDQILEQLYKAFGTNRHPCVLICNTVKGKGIPFAENKPGYSGVALSKEEMEEVIPKLKKIYE
ncbi:MAG: transketolase [Candidatus Gracilibacteria bacterium]|jgi:transketolase